MPRQSLPCSLDESSRVPVLPRLSNGRQLQYCSHYVPNTRSDAPILEVDIETTLLENLQQHFFIILARCGQQSLICNPQER